ncbi:hypothetical protein [Ideonella sp. B508-1]|uniref:hypothetical protein n=1 Tax=Ideonella sp. B508-1 TaxID=137716 RepID=UPI000683FD5A|nr:hypothetical protein [Ideonella sp. B508-1]
MAAWGFWKWFDRLRRLDGRPWNHKRRWRVCCELGLNIPRRTKRRIPKREPEPLAAGSLVNQGWTLDLMHDVLYDGCRFRTLNVINEADLEALAIQVALSLPASMLIRTMENLAEWYCPRLSICMDNGPEMTSHGAGAGHRRRLADPVQQVPTAWRTEWRAAQTVHAQIDHHSRHRF